jgi:hypothetical protein
MVTVMMKCMLSGMRDKHCSFEEPNALKGRTPDFEDGQGEATHPV